MVYVEVEQNRFTLYDIYTSKIQSCYYFDNRITIYNKISKHLDELNITYLSYSCEICSTSICYRRKFIIANNIIIPFKNVILI